MSVSFQDALATLQSMFGDLDASVIQVVLESNNGHMENTVDQLLMIKGEAPIQSQPSGGGSNNNINNNTRSASARRVEVPADFLMLPDGAPPVLSPDEAYRQDELLAQMMANEMFLRELQNHPEFGEYIPEGMRAAERLRSSSGNNDRRPPPRSSSGSALSNVESSIGERISKMGEAAKTKLSALATKFRRMTTRNQRGYETLDAAASSSGAQPLEAALLPSGSVSHSPNSDRGDSGVEMGRYTSADNI